MSACTYEYKAVTATGQERRGVWQADSEDEVYRHITSTGLIPVHIKAKRKIGFFARLQKPKITIRDLSLFTYQFSVLMEARLPIADGLRSISEEESNPSLRRMIQEVSDQIEAGCTITESFHPHRSVFGDVYIETIHAAEKSGNMVKVLSHLSEMLDQEVERRSAMRSALMYPLCIVMALVLAVTFMLVFVVPKFSTMFTERDIALPMPTQALLGVSSVFTTYWWLMLAGVVALFGLLRYVRNLPQGRALLDRCLHRVPVMAKALQSAALARFAHVFGLSLSSGLNLIDCLEMSGRASGRPMLIKDTQFLAEHVSQGG